MTTFIYDHILRKESGQPVGRVVLRSEKDYSEGKPFSAALVKFPKVLGLSYGTMEIWVDGKKYTCLVDSSRIKNRGNDHLVSNVRFIPAEDEQDA